MPSTITRRHAEVSRDPRPLPTRQQERLTQLKTEYNQGWRDHHELCFENFLPFGGRFFIDDRNIGDRRHGSIIDSTPLHSVRTLSAGLMSGATSPARVWFRLRFKNAEQNEDPAAQAWLSAANEIMLAWIGNSNLYHQLHRAYEEMAVCGTSIILLLPDDENIFHAYGATAGQFFLATDAKDKVDTCYREMQMTIAQVEGEFGFDSMPDWCKQAFNDEEFEREVHVCHAIEPNDDRYVEGSALKHQRRWRSTYFVWGETEDERGGHHGQFLRDGGFDEFPVLAFRWNVSGGDVYGNSPGMEALGDAIQLQHQQEVKSDVISKQARPPLQLPPSVKHHEVDSEADGRTTVPNGGREAGVRTLYEVRTNLNELREDIEDVRMRIRRTMFVDLFIMLQQIDKTMTAREVMQRNEEKLLMLGPMLERLFDDGLKPLINLIFYYLAEAGMFPEAPESLQDAELDVQFVSPLAQAQRGIGINAIDRFLQTAGAVGSMKPNALDNVNEDEVLRLYADILGIDPDLLNDPEVIAQMREARAQQQAAMEQAEALQKVTGAQKSAAEAAAAAPLDPIAQATGYSNPNVVAEA